MLRQFASGMIQFPLDKAVQLALALNVDVEDLFVAALRQDNPVPEGTKIIFPEFPTPDFLKNAKLVDLNFKVPSAFHRQLKVEATLCGWTMKRLLQNCLECFLTKSSRLTDLEGKAQLQGTQFGRA